MKYALAAIGTIAFFLSSAGATIKTQTIKYEQGGTKLLGFLAYDDTIQGKRPGIIVCPEWWGLDDYAKHRARCSPNLGMWHWLRTCTETGKPRMIPIKPGLGLVRSRRIEHFLRERVNAGLEQLKKNELVDTQKTGAIGYCFGGTTAIELAHGADVRAIVTFHAGLDSPNPADGRNIKGSILVCHGGNDSFTSEKDLDAFEQEMRENHVDWQMNIYGGAVHSFTNPNADKHGIPGIAYNAEADRRSWEAMQRLFNEVFERPRLGKMTHGSRKIYAMEGVLPAVRGRRVVDGNDKLHA